MTRLQAADRFWRMTPPTPYFIGNEAEHTFANWAIDQGWSVTKRGWPDYFCRRESEVMCVEVKCSDGLSHEQRRTAEDLTAHGIPTYVWWMQNRELEPISDLTELLTAEDIRLLDASRRLATDLRIERQRRDDLQRQVRKLTERLATLRSDRQTEQDALERIVDDLGYLLRQVQDHQRGHYTARMKVLLKRYNELTWQEQQ
jgi:hypothetical protein